MARYFIEVSYMGTRWSGFQKQANAVTIQSELEGAMAIYFRKAFELTGSSRTDAGVHAIQNYFHFDEMDIAEKDLVRASYHLNAILPEDIVVHAINRMHEGAHCRFDAISRTYEYSIYKSKNPFLKDRAFYFPFPVDITLLREAAEMVLHNRDFAAFSKKHTQVFNYTCEITESKWMQADDRLIFRITGNRFLRGMVRGLTGTMLRVGRKKLSLTEFKTLLASDDSSKVDFSVPAKGLILCQVRF